MSAEVCNLGFSLVFRNGILILEVKAIISSFKTGNEILQTFGA